MRTLVRAEWCSGSVWLRRHRQVLGMCEELVDILLRDGEREGGGEGRWAISVTIGGPLKPAVKAVKFTGL